MNNDPAKAANESDLGHAADDGQSLEVLGCDEFAACPAYKALIRPGQRCPVYGCTKKKI